MKDNKITIDLEELEIDEDMFEEDKINRFLNMIATQYDGNLATQYASSYLKKCNELDKYKQVLDKIKKYVLEVSQETLNNGRVFYNGTPAQTILDLLEEIE